MTFFKNRRAWLEAGLFILIAALVYLPEAITAHILWRIFEIPILPAVILLRLAGLLVYLAGGYAAIRMIPFGKWILTALALSPMALFQAATFTFAPALETPRYMPVEKCRGRR